MPDCTINTLDANSELRHLAVYLAQRVESYSRKRIENWINEKQVRVPLDARSVESLLQGIYDYGVMRGAMRGEEKTRNILDGTGLGGIIQ